MANPGVMMMAVTAATSGKELPVGMMAPPDTAPLRAAGEAFADKINKIFAGTGIPVAKALAYDATRIMKILENDKLPVQLGAANKDQMLKDLGVKVGSDILRLEQGITRYAFAIMSLPKVGADTELNYFAAMYQLGSSIPWDKVGVRVKADSTAGIGVL